METLRHFYNFVNKLNEKNSRNYKMEVLREYCNDDIVKYYLHFLFNPYIVTGISDKKLYKQMSKDGKSLYVLGLTNNNLNSFEDVLEYIKDHNTGSSGDVLIVNTFIVTKIPEDLKSLACSIVTKNLILGIDTLTINKCIPNLIPTFNVQLSNKYFEKPEYVEGKEFALTTKIDGGRIIALKENGQVSFYTRAGQRYEGLVDLENEMMKKLPDNICLDGELVAKDSSKKDTYKNTMKLSRTKDLEKHGVKMLVFDCMTAEEFRTQKCDTSYITRRNKLFKAFTCGIPDCGISTDVAIGCDPCEYYNSIIKFLNERYTYFQILPYLYIGNDESKITEYLNDQVANGEEGVMINIIDAPYSFKRTDNLLKVKKMNDLDLEIIGYEEGTNSLKGALGAFIVDYKDNKVKVGSGFTKDFRKEAWTHIEDYIGLTLEVQYFEETCNAQGGISLRFPVARGLRFDK